MDLPALYNQVLALQTQQAANALQAVNERVRGHGLTLSDAEIYGLVRSRARILRQTGRVEFGEGILPKLAFAFCDSPTIAPTDFASTLEALLDCFYTARNESMEAYSDDELLGFMRRHFDGDCHGSVEYLAGTLLEELARSARFGRAGQTMEQDEGRDEYVMAEEEGDDAD